MSWIKCLFLKGRSQIVHLDGVFSSPCDVLSGVPQGSVLGPRLFLLYINDLPQNLSSDCRLFADDILLYNIRENHKILQNDLNELEEWGKLWQLAFNNSKCSVLSLRTNYINNSRL